MFNTYASIMASEPTLFQSDTLSTISAVAGPVGTGFQLYNNVSNLLGGSWTGSGQQAQSSQASAILGQGQQVLTAITQTQQIINAGAQQLQNAKTRLVALTKGATGEGFVVLPVGKVVLGPAHVSKIAALHANQHHGAARALHAKLTARAGAYNAQIDLVVLQTNAADAQVALTLANSAVSVLGSLTKKDSGSASVPQVATGPLPTGVPPGAVTPTTPANPIAGATPGLPPSGVERTDGLASGGPLAPGVGALGLSGAGGGPLSAGAGLNPSALGGTAGLGPGMIAGRGAVVGEMAVAGGAGAMAPGMMYGGAGMAGGDAARRERDGSEWLAEDDDPWQADDGVNDVGGVLS